MELHTTQKSRSINRITKQERGEDEAFLQLVYKATCGDKEALKEICAQITEGVFLATSRIMNNREDAEDVAQESLLRVCKNIKKLQEPRAFRKWLNNIVVNEARRKMLMNTKLPVSFDLQGEQEYAVEENEEYLPDVYAENEEDKRAVYSAVDRLSSRQREAVLLHYYEGLSITETAVVMGIAQPGVSLYLKNARRSIKSQLEAQPSLAHATASNQAFLPIGFVLSQLLNKENIFTVTADQPWLQETFARYGEVAAASIAASAAVSTAIAAEGAAAASAAVASGSAAGTTGATSAGGILQTCLVACATVAAAAAIVVGAVMAPAANTVGTDYQPVNAVAEIVFTGVDSNRPHINPIRAEKVSDSSFGPLMVRYWEIRRGGGGYAVFEGDDNVVHDIYYQIRARGENGEFILEFYLEDATGTTYRLGHGFVIT